MHVDVCTLQFELLAATAARPLDIPSRQVDVKDRGGASKPVSFDDVYYRSCECSWVVRVFALTIASHLDLENVDEINRDTLGRSPKL